MSVQIERRGGRGMALAAQGKVRPGRGSVWSWLIVLFATAPFAVAPQAYAASYTLTGNTVNADVNVGFGEYVHGWGTINGTFYGHWTAEIVVTGGNMTLGEYSNFAFEHEGDIDVNSHTLTLRSNTWAQVGDPSRTLQLGAGSTGGTLVAPNGVSFDTGYTVTGFGTINGKVQTVYHTPVITASGGSLVMGDSSVTDGFRWLGTLNVGSNTVRLFDADRAVIGDSTTLAGGTLRADNGLQLYGGDQITGHGTVNAPFYSTATGTLIQASGGTLIIGKNTSTDGFIFAGTLDVGAGGITLRDADYAQVGPTTTLAGGTLKAGTGIELTGADQITGYGTVDAPLYSASISTDIIASGGNMTIGDSSTTNGFDFAGDMTATSNTVTVHDADWADLGRKTTLTNATLAAPNGVRLDGTNTLTGYGDVNAPVLVGASSTFEVNGGSMTAGVPTRTDGFRADGRIRIYSSGSLSIEDSDAAELG